MCIWVYIYIWLKEKLEHKVYYIAFSACFNGLSFILFLFIFFILSCPLKTHRVLSLAILYSRFYTACVTWVLHLGRKEINIGCKRYLQVFFVYPHQNLKFFVEKKSVVEIIKSSNFFVIISMLLCQSSIQSIRCRRQWIMELLLVQIIVDSWHSGSICFSLLFRWLKFRNGDFPFSLHFF